MSKSHTTTDHEKIRQWAEERGGYPARVHKTANWDDLGILRIEFRDPDDKLERLEWNAFFETFEADNLAFVYQEKTADGSMSRFCKFVER